MATSSAFPILATIEDCAAFHITVEPFIPQLYELPNRILDNIGSLQGLRQVYVETNPFIFGFAVSLALAVVFFIAAEINRNYSQIDRAWSILPNLYVVHFAVWAHMVGVPSARVEFLASATTIWSARLTYNYARKGGYNIGSQDYRWSIVSSKVPALVFVLFDATFIATIQSVLIYLFAAGPAYVLLLTCRFEADVAGYDWAFCIAMLLLVLVEIVSDSQQWAFQEAKRVYQRDAKVPRDCAYSQADLDRGFIVSGLWAYSRHPNFVAEQLYWFVLYQWSCFASKTLHSWAVTGSVALMMLFQGSTWLTELISSGKYPEYKHYQEKVGMFMPASFITYKPQETPEPRVIRTSELAKKQEETNKKEGNKKKA